MKIKIWLKKTSNPIEMEDVKNAYEKGKFYCIYFNQTVVKYPIRDIFRVEEDYPDKLRLSKEK